MAGAFEWFGKDGLFGNIGQVGTLIGGLGQAYGNVQQSKAANEMLNLQKESYYDEKKRRAKTQLALDNAFAPPALDAQAVQQLKLGV